MWSELCRAADAAAGRRPDRRGARSGCRRTRRGRPRRRARRRRRSRRQPVARRRDRCSPRAAAGLWIAGIVGAGIIVVAAPICRCGRSPSPGCRRRRCRRWRRRRRPSLCVQPVAGSQPSIVQALPSSQLTVAGVRAAGLRVAAVGRAGVAVVAVDRRCARSRSPGRSCRPCRALPSSQLIARVRRSRSRGCSCRSCRRCRSSQTTLMSLWKQPDAGSQPSVGARVAVVAD